MIMSPILWSCVRRYRIEIWFILADWLYLLACVIIGDWLVAGLAHRMLSALHETPILTFAPPPSLCHESMDPVVSPTLCPTIYIAYDLYSLYDYIAYTLLFSVAFKKKLQEVGPRKLSPGYPDEILFRLFYITWEGSSVWKRPSNLYSMNVTNL